MSKRLGNKLKELRGQRGWTQEELSKRSGIKRGYLASIEAGLVKNPSAVVFLKLASGLGISPEELYEAAGYVAVGRKSPRNPETLDEVIDRLKTVQPAAIPLYGWDDFPSWLGESAVPLDYVYRARSRAIGREMTAYVVSGTSYEPMVRVGDIILVDREEPLAEGEMMACRLDGAPVIGRVKKVGDETYVQTAIRQARFDECEAPVAIIEIRRWLEQDDWATIP